MSLLGHVAEKFGDILVPRTDVTRRASVPEIYQPLRTTSYTLSNIQHIFHVARPDNEQLRTLLDEILTRMLDRLLRTAPSKHLYLASVHHEGLRNYLDYVHDCEGRQSFS